MAIIPDLIECKECKGMFYGSEGECMFCGSKRTEVFIKGNYHKKEGE